MRKSLFGSLLGFFLVVGLSLALSANPNDPKKAEATKAETKTEKAACGSAEKKACGDKKEAAACGEKKAEGAKTETAPAKKGCCSKKSN
jgi:hypothetical protein